jgi:ClpP class serine protease
MSVAVDLILARPWAISPEWLDTMLAIAERQGDIAAAQQARAEREQRREAVYAYGTRPLEGTRTVRMRDSVALLEINGPIFRYASMFDDISGATSVQNLARDLQIALDSPAVDALILVMDSPGGEVDGIHALAQMIYAARGSKPIAAYVDGDACSAAQWIASAADEIVADATARLGSIGVRMSMRDPSSARAGQLVFVDSNADMKDPDPATAEGKAELMRQVNALASVFRADVAMMRSISEDAIISLRGGVRVGQEAVDAGLADRLGSLEGLIQEMAIKKRRPGMASAATEDSMAQSDADLQRELVAATPEEAEARLDANKIKTEVMDDVTKLLAERDQTIAAQAERLTAQDDLLNKQAEQLAALSARLDDLDGAQPVHLGYRASRHGPPPSEELAAQQPVVTPLDNFLDGK